MPNPTNIPQTPELLYLEAGSLREMLRAVAYRLSKSHDRAHDGLRIATTDLMIRADQAAGMTVPVSPNLLSELITFATSDN